jgi:hypothetical protein
VCARPCLCARSRRCARACVRVCVRARVCVCARSRRCARVCVCAKLWSLDVRMQVFLVGGADEFLVPKVDNTNVDRCADREYTEYQHRIACEYSEYQCAPTDRLTGRTDGSVRRSSLRPRKRAAARSAPRASAPAQTRAHTHRRARARKRARTRTPSHARTHRHANARTHTFMRTSHTRKAHTGAQTRTRTHPHAPARARTRCARGAGLSLRSTRSSSSACERCANGRPRPTARPELAR